MFALGADTLGITICEDCWNDKNFWAKRLYERDPVAELAGKGSTLLLNISSSPYTFDKRAFRFEMLRATARQHRLPFVYVNQVGGNDSLVFDGSSVAFMRRRPHWRAREIVRRRSHIFRHSDGRGRHPPADHREIEAVYRALVVGTRDYVRKCGFKQVVIGLSGGIDSSLVATIAVDALGPENVTGVAMPGPYSSEGSLRDAKALAENLGIRLLTMGINDEFHSYRKTLAQTFAGLPEDATEENLQARIRGNLLMALSNKFGSLVLSTGNKSEMAVGYCTLYGDMAGGLAVISDVPKTMVYELAAFTNRERRRIPESVFTKAPSAELRAESDRPGQLAALRRPRPNPEGIRRGPALAERNRRGDRNPDRPRASGRTAGRSQRVQAQAGAAGAEGHIESLQRRPPLPPGSEVFRLGEARSRSRTLQAARATAL